MLVEEFLSFGKKYSTSNDVYFVELVDVFLCLLTDATKTYPILTTLPDQRLWKRWHKQGQVQRYLLQTLLNNSLRFQRYPWSTTSLAVMRTVLKMLENPVKSQNMTSRCLLSQHDGVS